MTGGTVSYVLKNVGSLFKILFKTAGKEIIVLVSDFAKKISDTEPVNEKSPVSDIDSVVDIFERYKDEIRKRICDIEKSAGDEVLYYIEELRNFLEDRDIWLKKYGISRQLIERDIQRLLSMMDGFIDNEVCKGISLNHQEIRNIIKMLPGTQKEQFMEAYAGKVLKKALDTYCKQIRNVISELFEEVEEDIVCAVEAAEGRADRNRCQLESIDTDNYAERLEMIMARADYMMISCNLFEVVLKG